MIATKVKQKVNDSRITADFSNSTIHCGLDVHKKNWNVSIYVDGTFTKTFQQPATPEALLAYFQNHYPNAIYKACYEAGFCDFWVQRSLQDKGIDCIVT
jgi:hypothetical protein